MPFRQTALQVNCGYARVCIYENSNPGARGQLARKTVNPQKRLDTFRSTFETYPEYGIPEEYFVSDGKLTQLDRDSNIILDNFVKFRKDIRVPKQSYLSKFSSSQCLK